MRAVEAFTREELEAIVTADEHEMCEEDEYPGDYIHAYWVCETCACEAKLANLNAIAEAKFPGASPVYIPNIQSTTSQSITAGEVSIGDCAAQQLKPGFLESAYFQAIEIEQYGSVIMIVWRMTNSNDTVLTTYYDSDDELYVVTVRPIFRADLSAASS